MPIKTMQEFGDAIMEAVQVDIGSLPIGKTYFWYPAPGQDRPTAIRHGESADVLGDPYSRVIALFQDSDETRVYTLSLPPEPKPADWKDQPPRRYTLSKHARTYFVETMTVDTAADEIVKEWDMLGDAGVETALDELEAVLGFLRTQDALIGRDTLIGELESGAHHDDEDDDDDAAEETTAATVPAPVVAAPAPPEVTS